MRVRPGVVYDLDGNYQMLEGVVYYEEVIFAIVCRQRGGDGSAFDRTEPSSPLELLRFHIPVARDDEGQIDGLHDGEHLL